LSTGPRTVLKPENQISAMEHQQPKPLIESAPGGIVPKASASMRIGADKPPPGPTVVSPTGSTSSMRPSTARNSVKSAKSENPKNRKILTLTLTLSQGGQAAQSGRRPLRLLRGVLVQHLPLGRLELVCIEQAGLVPLYDISQRHRSTNSADRLHRRRGSASLGLGSHTGAAEAHLAIAWYSTVLHRPMCPARAHRRELVHQVLRCEPFNPVAVQPFAGARPGRDGST
jgi:hypothetical protein